MKLLPDLTKSYILARVKEEEIMEYYLKIPVNANTLGSNSFLSPFRPANKQDKNPSAGYYYGSDSRLRVRDFSGYFHGDCFDVAAWVTKINISTKQGFRGLLHKIAYDFKIHKYSNSEERAKFKVTYTELLEKQIRIIKVTPRAWNKFDGDYWYRRFNISKVLLQKGKVLPVYYLQIEGKDGYLYDIYEYNPKNPAYAYYGGKKHGIDIWKIYFPFATKSNKFLSNYSFIQGYHLMQPAEIGIITKSYKDALCFRSFGYEACAVANEHHIITKDTIFSLKSKYNILITNFDYDTTGIKLARIYRDLYGIPPIMFTRGRFNQIDYGVKDLTEFTETYSTIKTELLFDTVFEKYHTDLTLLRKIRYEESCF